MEKIEWSAQFSVGNETIDNQHKDIIDLINILIENSELSPHSKIVSETLSLLVNYSREHFKYEEQFLSTLKYPGVEEQIKDHKEFKLEVAGFYDAAILNISGIPQALLMFLKEWWVTHILVEDMKYSDFLKENEKASTLK